MMPLPVGPDEKLAREAQESAQKIAALEERVNKLSTLCNALLVTFQKHTGFSEEEFIAILKTAEQKQRKAVYCEACGHVLQRGYERCIYCGAAHALALGKFA
jgi:ribosomal protein S14